MAACVFDLIGVWLMSVGVVLMILAALAAAYNAGRNE